MRFKLVFRSHRFHSNPENNKPKSTDIVSTYYDKNRK